MNNSTADVVIRLLTALTVIGLALAAVLDEPEADDFAALILRAALGMMIFVHGYNKAFRGGRIDGTAGWFQSMGMRPGKVHAITAASAEMGVGALLVVGLLTPLAAAGLIALMMVAFWTVHRDKGFMITGEGWEYVALIAVAALVCATLGPGDVSLDAALDIANDLDGWTGLWVALLIGLGSGTAQLLLFYRPDRQDQPTTS